MGNEENVAKGEQKKREGRKQLMRLALHEGEIFVRDKGTVSAASTGRGKESRRRGKGRKKDERSARKRTI